MGNINEISRLSEDLNKKEEQLNQMGIFDIEPVNQIIINAQKQPDPTPLWLSLWHEGEVCCLFADANLGKSIYAVQIANSVAQKKRVIYFDFELSDKQFQLRYTDDEGNLFNFPDNLFRASINVERYNCTNIEDTIMDDIGFAVIQKKAEVIIIDNITYICSSAEKADMAGALMMKLIEMKRKYNLSILILAHTPKRNMTRPITQNDLAGSKRLFNLFDSAFAIGQSAKNANLRYIKQIKVRYGAFVYGAGNVIVCNIEKIGTFLSFNTIDYCEEREHLRERSSKEEKEEIEKAKKLASEGKSVREIAEELNTSKSRVDRLLKK